MLYYELDNTRSEPLYVQIYEKIKDDIELGEIKPDEKLPSKRAFSAQLGISIITVENAYNQLLDEGYIRSVPKKGYYARSIEKNLPPVAEGKLPCRVQYEENNDMENDLFPFTVWAKLMREELSYNKRKLLTKPPFEGVYELRTAIAEHLKRFRNISVMPEQVIIGAGTEYLYMLINLLFGSNYIFGVEEPGYSKIADIYSNYNIKCEHIPMFDDGVDMDYLKSIKTDIIHISPSHHFPTGAITSIGKRYALLEWASLSPDRYIIEDDYDSEFRLSGKPIPSMFSIDVMGKVIYMNTFSKSLSSTIRISYMILPPSILDRFRKKIGFYSCPVSTFEQYTLARFIQEGYFEKHINRMRVHYKKCRNHLFEQMKKFDIFRNAEIFGENAGLHCTVKFDTTLSDDMLLENIIELGFKASLIKRYYHEKNQPEHHTLIFFY